MDDRSLSTLRGRESQERGLRYRASRRASPGRHSQGTAEVCKSAAASACDRDRSWSRSRSLASDIAWPEMRVSLTPVLFFVCVGVLTAADVSDYAKRVALAGQTAEQLVSHGSERGELDRGVQKIKGLVPRT